MAGFLALLVAVLLVPLTLHLFTDLDQKQKRVIFLICALLAVAAGLFQFQNLQTRTSTHELVIHFQQGGALSCQGDQVHQEAYDLITGTLTFIGKSGTPLEGKVVSIEKCALP